MVYLPSLKFGDCGFDSHGVLHGQVAEPGYASVLETDAFGHESSTLSLATITFFDIRKMPVNGRQTVLKTVGWC